MLHCVRAFEPVMLELAAREPRAVIFHGFIGSPEQARRALEKGYYLSFGVRTFSSPKTMEALRETPPGSSSSKPTTATPASKRSTRTRQR